jgi:MerR family transcriptional regulator, light-induced transcriptional regulator
MTAPAGRISLRDAAVQLGVHYQTAYRWVRQGVLPAVKVGGSYEVTAEAVLARQQARAEPTPPPAHRVVRDWDPFTDRFYAALASGDESGARDLIGDLVGSRLSLVEICDRVMSPALTRVGQAWADGTISVAEEHRASSICERVLGRWSPAPPGRPRGTAVVCVAPSDEHGLPAQMATAALREHHWRVHHLGVGVPVADTRRLVAAEGASLVVISVTLASARPEADALAEVLRADGCRVLVGGPGLTTAGLVAEVDAG